MNLPQRNLAGGELDPALHANTGLQKYTVGLATLRNCQVRRSGGVESRPGFRFVCRTKYSNKKARLIPFIYTDSYAFALEFGEEYIRFIWAASAAPISDTDLGAVTALTEDVEAEFTIVGHGLVDDQEVTIYSWLSPLPAPDFYNRRYKVSDATTDTFKLKYVGGANDGDYLSTDGLDTSTPLIGIAPILEIETDYQEEDLFDLQFVQSGNKLIITHPSYEPSELIFDGPADWTFGPVTFAPAISAPANLTSSGSTGSGNDGVWAVTAIDDETFEESLPSLSHTTTATKTTLSWDAVTGAREYNIYKRINGIYGLVYIVGSNSWTIEGSIAPNRSETRPIARDPFDTDYPRTVAHIQQRLAFGSTTLKPEHVWLSRTGFFKNFTIRSPIQDDDAITFPVAGRTQNEIRHILDLGKLVILTSAGEWVAEGGGEGVLTPFAVNLKQQSYNGASRVRPVVIGKEALYVQARASKIMSLGFNYEVDGYAGSDLTIFAAHLFDGKSIVEMAYQQVPHSVLWVVRGDGGLLGMTYVKEHQIFAWHRHDTDGEFESIINLPFLDRDAVYAIVTREIDGEEFQCIEYMVDRNVEDQRDHCCVDASLSWYAYKGRVEQGRMIDESDFDKETVTLSTGAGWTEEDTITLTRSNIHALTGFSSSAVTGKEIHVRSEDGTEVIRFTDLEYVDGTHVTGKPNRTIPASMRGVALSDWVIAFNTVGNLWFLEGKEVSVYADGFVVSSPNNPQYEDRLITVENGQIELPEFYSKVHIGLPFISDIETLDIDTPQGQSLVEMKKFINKVTLRVLKTRGVWAGPEFPTGDDPTEGMSESPMREEEGYDDPISEKTGYIDILIQSGWSKGGRVCIRQVDPLPMAVMAIIPSGIVSLGG